MAYNSLVSFAKNFVPFAVIFLPQRTLRKNAKCTKASDFDNRTE